ncbi:MAG: glycosyltransferase family 4 protein [Candidatus Aenigmarchaeota archaeon]|nr:glycosyltransferase family 4 protein [Candidatus Aenigmarchaeota archaeon]
MIGIYAPFNMQKRTGNTIRPSLQAEGLLKNGFNSFRLFSLNPNIDLEVSQERVGEKFIIKKFPLGQKLNKLDVDLVHAHHYYGAMVLKQRYILDMPSFKTLETGELYKKAASPLRRFVFRRIFNPHVQKKLERKMIRNAERVICASESIKENVLKHNPDTEIDVIRNTVKPELYEPTKCKEFVVGTGSSSFSNPMERETLKIIYEIAKRSDFQINITGEMSLEQARQFKELGNVNCLGSKNHDDYIEFLRNISVFLLPFPDFCNYGGSKFKLLEAGACSLPIVSTTTGTVGFEPKNTISIADSVDGLIVEVNKLKDENLRKPMGRKIRSVIESDYNYIEESKKLMRIYRETL